MSSGCFGWYHMFIGGWQWHFNLVVILLCRSSYYPSVNVSTNMFDHLPLYLDIHVCFTLSLESTPGFSPTTSTNLSNSDSSLPTPVTSSSGPGTVSSEHIHSCFRSCHSFVFVFDSAQYIELTSLSFRAHIKIVMTCCMLKQMLRRIVFLPSVRWEMITSHGTVGSALRLTHSVVCTSVA